MFGQVNILPDHHSHTISIDHTTIFLISILILIYCIIMNHLPHFLRAKIPQFGNVTEYRSAMANRNPMTPKTNIKDDIKILSTQMNTMMEKLDSLALEVRELRQLMRLPSAPQAPVSTFGKPNFGRVIHLQEIEDN